MQQNGSDRFGSMPAFIFGSSHQADLSTIQNSLSTIGSNLTPKNQMASTTTTVDSSPVRKQVPEISWQGERLRSPDNLNVGPVEVCFDELFKSTGQVFEMKRAIRSTSHLIHANTQNRQPELRPVRPMMMSTLNTSSYGMNGIPLDFKCHGTDWSEESCSASDTTIRSQTQSASTCLTSSGFSIWSESHWKQLLANSTSNDLSKNTSTINYSGNDGPSVESCVIGTIYETAAGTNSIKGQGQNGHSSRPQSEYETVGVNQQDKMPVDRAAQLHRYMPGASTGVSVWVGQLPVRDYSSAKYSQKVFIGGVPCDITEAELLSAFRVFEPLKAECPGTDTRNSSPLTEAAGPPKRKGFAYVIFKSEKSVNMLVNCCSYEHVNGGELYFRLVLNRFHAKESRYVQIIPWKVSDCTYIRGPSTNVDFSKTVFVGAIHGMITAPALAGVMQDLFGGVVHAGIDTDKYWYPIGSGRVTFDNEASYLKAVKAAFVEVKTAKFKKTMQIDPFLEDTHCSLCCMELGLYFCRELTCFRYFCQTCWQKQHCSPIMSLHKPVTRIAKRKRSVNSIPEVANNGN